MADEIGLSMGFIDPASIPESDVVGVNTATCRCGRLTLGPFRSTIPGASVKTLCTNCGDWIEPLPQPWDNAATEASNTTEGGGRG